MSISLLIIIMMSFLGILIGVYVPVIPYEYAKYTAVAIMAALDSIMGAINAKYKEKFDLEIFVSGFFINSIIAIILTIFGEGLDVNIFLAAIFVFVFRIFNNFSSIRREIIKKHKEKIEEKVAEDKEE